MNELEKQKKELISLLKKRRKDEKKLQKDWERRMSSKYTDKALKAAKKTMLEQAYTIDSLEYRKIANELKKRLDGDNEE